MITKSQFILTLMRAATPVPNRSINNIVCDIPSFKAIQLTSTKGYKPIRTINLKPSCFAIKLAEGGEYL